MTSHTGTHSKNNANHANHPRRNHSVNQHTHHHARHPYYNIVVIAASAGGINALREVLSDLPEDFPVPIAIIQHRTAEPPWYLDEILGKKTKLKVKYATRSEPLAPGTVYIAPHDHHLLVRPDHRFSLTNHTKVRHVRPSANPLFSSAAEIYKGKVIAVVLTGGDRDATDGVQAVKAAGGIVVAQDKATSEHFSMPESAIATGCVDYVLPLNQISEFLTKLVKTGKAATNRHRDWQPIGNPQEMVDEHSTRN
jgi:two-component system chemotaxis response regulator CheB